MKVCGGIFLTLQRESRKTGVKTSLNDLNVGICFSASYVFYSYRMPF